MPGFFWLCRVTMLETMLIFFFTLVMFAFYTWLNKERQQPRVSLMRVSVGHRGVGEVSDYRCRLAMLLSIIFLARKHLKLNLAKFLVIYSYRRLGCCPMVPHDLPLQRHDKIRNHPIRHERRRTRPTSL